MAFWSRVKESQIKVLSNGLKRFYLEIHNPSELQHGVLSHTTIGVRNRPVLIIHTNRVEFLNSVRLFAAPVQAKPKKEERDTSGIRLNEKVTAAFVRLVTDEGHAVVSRHEALDRAKRLNLDLVEVDPAAKPPVCKLMDYHKEKYIKQVKGKELAKKKADLSLRKGGCKEVRFLGKTEQKDLKVKADTIRRMMDKGYRVKCMAVGNGSVNENLGEVLARLSSLIDDVALIESGPHVEKKQAYIIVRHAKYGPLKKGKKASKIDVTSSVEESGVEPGVGEDLTDDETESTFDWSANEDADEVSNPISTISASMPAAPFQIRGNTPAVENNNRYRRETAASQQAPPPGGENRYRREAAASQQAPPSGGENRYRREAAASQQAPPSGGENRYRREPPQFNMNKFSGTHRSPNAENNAHRKDGVEAGLNRYKKESHVSSARYSTHP